MVIDAVLFDMDGTLIQSEYDWKAIRAELEISGVSIIDELNSLPEPRRTSRWKRLEEIEREASDKAALADGTRELLNLLSVHGVKTALVTNNSSANAEALQLRLGIRFGHVVTRDSGLFKPSGAPLVEAMRRLRVEPARVLAVGDSRFDLAAGRDAGCGTVAVVNDGAAEWRTAADLCFEDLVGLLRHLESEFEA